MPLIRVFTRRLFRVSGRLSRCSCALFAVDPRRRRGPVKRPEAVSADSCWDAGCVANRQCGQAHVAALISSVQRGGLTARPTGRAVLIGSPPGHVALEAQSRFPSVGDDRLRGGVEGSGRSLRRSVMRPTQLPILGSARCHTRPCSGVRMGVWRGVDVVDDRRAPIDMAHLHEVCERYGVAELLCSGRDACVTQAMLRVEVNALLDRPQLHPAASRRSPS